MESFNSFLFTLNTLDLSGTKNALVTLQDLRRFVKWLNILTRSNLPVWNYRFRNLRSLSLSRLVEPHIDSNDFLEFGVDLEELSINYANLQSIKNNAFKYVHGLKHIDLSDNNIGTIDNSAFADVSFLFRSK